MPTRLEATLREQAQKKFPGNEKRQDAYIFGTLRKTGWKPQKESKS